MYNRMDFCVPCYRTYYRVCTRACQLNVACGKLKIFLWFLFLCVVRCFWFYAHAHSHAAIFSDQAHLAIYAIFWKTRSCLYAYTICDMCVTLTLTAFRMNVQPLAILFLSVSTKAKRFVACVTEWTLPFYWIPELMLRLMLRLLNACHSCHPLLRHQCPSGK